LASEESRAYQRESFCCAPDRPQPITNENAPPSRPGESLSNLISKAGNTEKSPRIPDQQTSHHFGAKTRNNSTASNRRRLSQFGQRVIDQFKNNDLSQALAIGWLDRIRDISRR